MKKNFTQLKYTLFILTALGFSYNLFSERIINNFEKRNLANLMVEENYDSIFLDKPFKEPGIADIKPTNKSMEAAPSITITNSPEICLSENSASLSFTTTDNPTTYNILFSNAAKSAGFNDVTDENLTSNTINISIPSSASSGTYTGTISVTNDTGTSAAESFSITINAIPTVTKPADGVACNNEQIAAISFTGSSVNGTTYSWTNDNTAIGLGTSGNGNISAFAAKNTTNAPISANITVTPSANGCDGTPQTFKITVNPTSTVSKPADVVACNNEQIVAISFTGSSVSGTTYNWTNDNTNIGLAASGNSNISAFSAKNTTNAPISANITVTPTANGCEGTPQTFKITVNPTSTVTKPSDIVACNNEQIAAISLTGSSVTGTTYNWTNDNTNIGLASSGNGNISTFAAKNTTNAPISAIITVTPSANGCDGSPQIFKITVNPTSTVTKPADVVACNNEQIAAINFSGSSVNGTTYSWTNDNTAIGLGASGNSNIATFTAKNTTSAPISANITVTPSANGCDGTPQTFKITVNPTSTVTKPSDVVACNNEQIAAISLTGSSVTGTTYSWTNDNTAIGLGASGNSNIAAFTAKNSTNAPISANIIVTPFANGCDGTPQTFKITVNPTSTVTKPTDVVACNEGQVNTISFSGSQVNGTTYKWINDKPSIGLASSGTGNISAFTAVNSGTTPLIATITVTPEANGCQGTRQSFQIKVNPSIVVEFDTIPVTCNGAGDGKIEITKATGGNENLRFSLDNSDFVNTTSFNNLPGGSYTLYVKDSQVCTKSYDFVIGEPNELTATAPTSTEVSCYGGNDGTITAGNVSGGNSDNGYQYSINNIDFFDTKEFTGLAAGDYTIFIKDSKNCSLQSNITVNSISKMEATITKKDVNCFGGSDGEIIITNPKGGHNNYEYKLDNGTWQTSPTFTGLAKANYAVSIRDANNPGCEVILEPAFQIAQPISSLAVTVTSTRTTTYGLPTGSATANPTGGTPGYTYEWRPAGSQNILQTTKTATNLAAGDYVVTVIDSKGCKITANKTIIDALEAIIVPISICQGDEDSIRTSFFEVENGSAHGGVPGYTYVWNFGDGMATRTGAGPHKVNYTTTGNKTITLTVTDSEGKQYVATEQQYVGMCYEPCGKSNNIVFNPDNIYLGTIDGTPINTSILGNCNNSTPKYIFLQVDKAANIYNPYTELSYTVSNGILSASENYFAKGCRSKDEVDDDPNDNKDGKVGGFIRLTSSPIAWECGDNLDIESFYITWTNVDKKKCGQSNNAFCYSTNEPVIVPTLLKAEAIPTNINCKGSNTGVISTKVSGGFAPYFYNITGPGATYGSSSSFTGLLAGTYTVYVKDLRGQKTTAQVTITEPTTKVAATVVKKDPVCYGYKGEATVTGSNGTPFNTGEAYQYIWNDASQQTTATATNLSAGEYTVTVIDANGCQTIQTVTIIDPAQLTVATVGDPQTLKCGFKTTTLEANDFDSTIEKGEWTILSGTGGTIMEPNNPNSEFQGNAGTYELQWTISDLNGNCSTSDTTSVGFSDDCSQLDFDGVDDHVIFGDQHNFSSNSFTIEAWVKPKSVDGVRTILSKRNSKDLASGGFDLIINSGAPTFRWGNNTISTTGKLSTSRWYHMAVTYNASKSEYILFVDGIKLATKSGSNPIASANPFIIGAMFQATTPDMPVNYFHGWIEEVRLWGTNLTEEQLHFIMNQRLEIGKSPIKGDVLPLNIPKNPLDITTTSDDKDLNWSDLKGYYQLMASEVTNGITLDKSSSGINGELKNIETDQENTAPLPYVAVNNNIGTWSDRNSWAHPDVWDWPNATGINGNDINWNIAEISFDMKSGGHDITLLGLLSLQKDKLLEMKNPNSSNDENNSGQGLTITHYLKLDGNIDLVGESQLVQTGIDLPTQTISSVLEPSSIGYIERDQQGTANSFNYNYWSSPVSLRGAATNSGYTISQVMLNGTNSLIPTSMTFVNGPYGADDAAVNITNYWLYKFRGTASIYSEWKYVGSTGKLSTGEGYTMKGTSGDKQILDRQNYTFRGKPNNGDITLNIGMNQNYLLGNPYPSALNADKFIKDNLKKTNGGTNTSNIFNGALYFWDHFAGKTHNLAEYIGGYATYNLSGGVPAVATDERINNTGESSRDYFADAAKIPQKYIPVAQGFFINTDLDPGISGNITVDGGDVVFKNSQRAFARESKTDSQFLSQEKSSNQEKQSDTRSKIRLVYESPMGFNRQILVTEDENTTNDFDLGYDAMLNDSNPEDMYWVIKDNSFVIQGVPNFDKDQVLPLGVKLQDKGEFRIKINALENIKDDVEIYLKNVEDSTYHDLRAADFVATLEGGTYKEKYALVFQKPKSTTPNTSEETDPDTTEGTDENSGETPDENPSGIIPPGKIDVIYSLEENRLRVLNPDLMFVETVQLFNVLGQQVESYKTMSNSKEIGLPVRDYPKAVYLVKVKASEGTVSKTILIKR